MSVRVRTGLAVAVAAAITTAGCGNQGATGPSKPHAGDPAPSSSPTASPTGTNATLARAVLSADEAPPGTSYLSKDSGRQSLVDVLHSGADAAKLQAQLRKTGFKDAYRSLFVGSPGLDSLGATQRSVANFALVFGTPRAASRARAQLDSTINTTGTATPLPDPHLGSADTALQAPVSQLHGTTYYYSWQQGPVVRVLIDAGGTQATSATTSLELARALATGATPSPRSAARSLVLQRTDAPHGTEYSPARSGPRKASDFGSATAAARLTRLGLRSAYSALFLSPGLAHPQSGKTTAPTNVVASQAQQYSSAANASRAYHVFVDRQKKLFQGHTYSQLDGSGLGSEGFGFRYVDSKSTGDVVGIGYFWRAGDLVLSLSVVGSPKFSSESAARTLGGPSTAA